MPLQPQSDHRLTLCIWHVIACLSRPIPSQEPQEQDTPSQRSKEKKRKRRANTVRPVASPSYAHVPDTNHALLVLNAIFDNFDSGTADASHQSTKGARKARGGDASSRCGSLCRQTSVNGRLTPRRTYLELYPHFPRSTDPKIWLDLCNALVKL